MVFCYVIHLPIQNRLFYYRIIQELQLFPWENAYTKYQCLTCVSSAVTKSRILKAPAWEIASDLLSPPVTKLLHYSVYKVTARGWYLSKMSSLSLVDGLALKSQTRLCERLQNVGLQILSVVHQLEVRERRRRVGLCNTTDNLKANEWILLSRIQTWSELI